MSNQRVESVELANSLNRLATEKRGDPRKMEGSERLSIESKRKGDERRETRRSVSTHLERNRKSYKQLDSSFPTHVVRGEGIDRAEKDKDRSKKVIREG